MCALIYTEKMSENTDAPVYVVMWGPVEHETARKYGASAGCASILVRPVDANGECRSVMERVRALIPKALLPCVEDDTASLVRRLAAPPHYMCVRACVRARRTLFG